LILLPSTISIDPALCGGGWIGGSSVRVSVVSHDNAHTEFCGPNHSNTVWTFNVAPGAPVGNILDPFNGAWSSCADQVITVNLMDYDVGVDPATIR
jgi:hypothetical protein